MATHSSSLAWKIPWTEEPGRLQSLGLQRVGHDWATLFYFTFTLIAFYGIWTVLFNYREKSHVHYAFDWIKEISWIVSYAFNSL